MLKFTNVEMCRITEELIFQEPYQVGASSIADLPAGWFGCRVLVITAHRGHLRT